MLVAADDGPQVAQPRRGFRPLSREKSLFRLFQPGQGVLNSGRTDFGALDRLDHCLEHGRLQFDVAAANQQSIAPGVDRLDCRRGHRHASADRLHLEVVAQNDPLVSKFGAQQTLDDGGRQRCRTFLVECWNEHMCRHDEGDALTDGGSERLELYGSDSIR